jgi:hypothetical protein
MYWQTTKAGILGQQQLPQHATAIQQVYTCLMQTTLGITIVTGKGLVIVWKCRMLLVFVWIVTGFAYVSTITFAS